MNIFAVDTDPVAAAQALHDQHVVKMVLESAQMICTIVQKHGHSAPYRPTHLSHPCVLWAGRTNSNALWLHRHALALCAEYTHRFGKRHASQIVIESFGPLMVELCPEGTLEPFAQAMPDECKASDPVDGYRTYYRQHKLAKARYTHSQPPMWAA